MALSKYTLMVAFRKALLEEIPNPTPEQRLSAERVATKMSNAVNAFVRSATVVTVGTATTQTSAPGGIT